MKTMKKTAARAAAIILINCALIVSLSLPFDASAVYRTGSQGSTVREIQTRLKNWGYYTGSVDGIYGSRTTAAVRYFQSRNGLAVDGIAGPRTLAAMGIAANKSGGGSSSYNNNISLLARMISAEGRGEPYNGQVAIGAVIMNRIKHPSFPNTLAGVLYQPGAFTAVTDGQFNQPTADSARRAAVDAYNGVDPTYGCIYYYNPAKTSNKFMLSRPVVMTIGKHRFTR